MKNISKKALILIFIATACFHAHAEVDNKNFEFKGYKFGSKPKNQEVAKSPAEKMFGDLGYHQYPRIKEFYETNSELLYFGETKLDKIQYIYFDEKLFKISVFFHNERDCSKAREANEMIEVKYGIKTKISEEAKINQYKSQFNNSKISIVISCEEPSLDAITGTATNDRHTTITFKDVRASKKSEEYKMQEYDLSIQKKKKEKEDEIRKKINF